MSIVLTRPPLRTTRAFISPDHAVFDPQDVPSTDGDERPFGYAYSTPWGTEKRADADGDPQAGHYDPVSQTWRGADGEDVVAGYSSYTKTGIGSTDRVLDDLCA
ncbi:hypothetical protein [Actinomadura flavalba]|uniref:hypothetical protein n=1 Tax=Actinomadura flavalba TaxID=1120938 RepID=UPI00036D162A|nr:hypothetical protein [Actinomadura flavalba]